MIEQVLRNELSRKRWRFFKRQKRAYYSMIALLFFSFFSFTAEIWSNSKPLMMSYRGRTYFPVIKDYHPTEFGITNVLVTNYRVLEKPDLEWAIWPLIEWNPYEGNKKVYTYPSGPTKENLFGTDESGRDVLSRILYGYRYSITYAVTTWILVTFLAIVLGGIMGYIGGAVDLIGQRVVEVINSIPVLFILLILVSIFNPNIWLLVVLTSLFGWIFLSDYVRAEFLKNRKKEYVEAARAMGGSHFRIIFKHILPNSLIPIFTFSPFIIAGYVNGLATLDYLGFGLSPPTPSWGELLGQAQSYFTTAWWLALFPSLFLFSTLVLLAMIGNGVRVAFDPKTQL